MSPRASAFLLLALSIIPGIPASQPKQPAQQPAVQTPSEIKVRTELIQLHATVMDRQGRLVGNLGKEDFILQEDGTILPIAFFSEILIPTSVTGESAPGTKLRPAPFEKLPFPAQGTQVSRSIVLLADTLNTSQDGLAAIRAALHRYVDELVGDHDVVALKTTTGMLGVMEQFVQDRKMLGIGIDKIVPWRVTPQETLFTPYLAGRILREDQRAIDLGIQILRAEEGTGMPDGYRPKGLDDVEVSEAVSQALTAVARSNTKARAQSILAEAGYQRQIITDTLSAVVEKLKDMPGQRMIAFFSDGFSSVGTSGQAAVSDLQPIISRATRSGIVFYTFNAKGLAIPMVTAAMPGGAAIGTASMDRAADEIMTSLNENQKDLEHAMGVLAAETGGDYFTNSNNFAGGLQRMLLNNRISYEVAYYPPLNRDASKLRHITLRVKDHPEYRVRTQTAYVLNELRERPAGPEPTTATGRLHRAMSEPLPVIDIRLAATAKISAEQKRLDVWIKGEDLSFSANNGQPILDLDVEAVIFNSWGKMVKTIRDRLNSPLSGEQVEKLRQKDLQYMSRLSLDPGIYHVRIGVRDAASNRMGTALVWLEIPKSAKTKPKR